MHALFLAATNGTNMTLANKLNGLVMKENRRQIAQDISSYISEFVIDDHNTIAENICREYIKFKRDLNVKNPELDVRLMLSWIEREEFLLSFPTYGKETIDDENDGKIFLEKI